MPYTLQFKRYSTVTLGTVTGAAGEIIVDSTKKTVTIHDGATVGGTPLATEIFVSSALTSYALNASLTSTLASYTLNTNLTSTLVSYTTNANLTSTLNSYTTNANLTSTLNSYTTNANLTSTLSSYQAKTSTLTLVNLTASTITVTSLGISVPNRPAFRVIGSGVTNLAVNSILTSTCVTVEHNQGNYLNTSTGIFTVPADGFYQIHLNSRVSTLNNAMSQIVIIKNPSGSSQILLMWEANASCTADHFGVSTVSKLTSGDTLIAKVVAGTINFDSNDSWSVTYIGP